MPVRAGLMIGSLLLGAAANADQFCLIDNTGRQIGCYPTFDACQVNGMGWPSSSCMYLPGPQARQPTIVDSFMSGMKEGQQQRERQEQQKQQLRAATDPHLLPLVPSDTGVSAQSQSLIYSTLNSALEMDAPNSTRRWQNSGAGSYGTVTVGAEQTSRYGEVCRSFRLTLTMANGETRDTSGLACRINGEWVWR